MSISTDYVVLQNPNTQIQQQISGLVAGTMYVVSFLAAERPGEGADERLGVLVNNAFVPSAQFINPHGQFTRWSFAFTAAATNVIAFRNTMTVAGSIFVDAVTICLAPTTTPVPPVTRTTVTATTTATGTTETIYSNSFRGVDRDITAAVSRIAAAEVSASTLSNTVAALQSTTQSTMATLSLAQAAGFAQITAMSTMMVNAVAFLPPASPPTPPSTPGTTLAVPSIEVTSSGNLLLAAPGRNVQLEGMCGVLNPCDLLAALQALRAPSP